MTKICKKAAQHFHWAVSKVFDRVKSVALWSANIRTLAKDHKGYGSAVISIQDKNLTKENNENMRDNSYWLLLKKIVGHDLL